MEHVDKPQMTEFLNLHKVHDLFKGIVISTKYLLSCEINQILILMQWRV